MRREKPENGSARAVQPKSLGRNVARDQCREVGGCPACQSWAAGTLGGRGNALNTTLR